MGRAYRLETFDTEMAWAAMEAAPEQPTDTLTPPPQLEEMRLEAFESGYKAGWDDAEKAQNGDSARISAELARNLEDLGFTLHEAREHVLRTLGPLMTEIVEVLLPEFVRTSIAPTVLDTVLPLAESGSESEMEILTAPTNRQAIETLLKHETPIAVHVKEEATLADGQAFIRLGSVEKEVDLNAIQSRIGAALRDAFDLKDKARANG